MEGCLPSAQAARNEVFVVEISLCICKVSKKPTAVSIWFRVRTFVSIK